MDTPMSDSPAGHDVPPHQPHVAFMPNGANVAYDQAEALRGLLYLIRDQGEANHLYTTLNDIAGRRRIGRMGHGFSDDSLIAQEEAHLDDIVDFCLNHLATLLSGVNEPF